MKAVTNDYKNEIKTFGRELNDKLYYTENEQIVYIPIEQINSITPRFTSNLLKSTMKELELDSNINIPLGTILTYEFGVKVNNAYEYINYGNFIVYSCEKMEEYNSYRIICYDKMLYAMKEYVDLNITYPITIRSYINAICTYLGLTFKNTNEEFTNYDKQIPEELYLDSNDKTIGYTFRDVLDELAQATASTICINNNDELEIRYVNDLINSTNEVEGTTITITDNDYDKVQELQLKGNTSQNGTPTPSTPVPINVVTGRQEINVMRKNIFDGELELGNYNTNTGEKISGSSYTRNKNFIPVEELTNYKLSLNGSGIAMYVFEYKADYSYNLTSRKTINADEYLTTNSGTKYINFRIVAQSTDLTAKIQVEKGTSASLFEPYNGKSYEINLGKNLIYNNVHTQEETFYDVKYTPNSDGSISVEGTATGDYNYYILGSSNNYPLVLEPGTYTLSGSISNNAWVRLYDGTTYYDATTNLTKTFTITQTTRLNVRLRVKNGTTINDTFYPQLEKGIATPYSPYKTPIELCKIDTYQDSIKYANYKNICPFDISNAWESGTYGMDGVKQDATARIRLKDLLKVKPSTVYYFNTFNTDYRFIIRTYDSAGEFVRSVGGVINGNTVTTSATEEYFGISMYNATSSSGVTYNTYITLFEDGSIKPFICLNSETDKTYEPYGTDWYIEKQIGKVVLDGSENWILRTDVTTQYGYYTFRNGDYVKGTTITNSNGLSNYFRVVTSGITNSNNIRFVDTQGYGTQICIDGNIAQTTANVKTWLGNHNVIVYYPLANPTYTFIEDEELINQLEGVRLLEGLNNIIVSSSDLSSPIKLTYVDDYETIDEEYLKDVNVAFKDEPVKINAVTLIKNIESDAISIRDEESINENGLYDLQIKNNLLMSGDDRQLYLEEIFNRLNGLTYYTNDFSSTGITYLELCDKYKVKVRDKIYYCIMFNDEPIRTTGLTENIYTEDLEFVKTNYVKIDRNVKRETETYIRLDEQAHEIELKASKNEIISTINLSPEQIEINSDKISLAGKTINMTSDNIAINSSNFSVDKDGYINSTGGTIGGFTLGTNQFTANLISQRIHDNTYTNDDATRLQNILLGNITPTQEDYDKYDFDNSGAISSIDLLILRRILNGTTTGDAKFSINTDTSEDAITMLDEDDRIIFNLGIFGIIMDRLLVNYLRVKDSVDGETFTVSGFMPKVLFDGYSQGTITLSEDINLFSYLEIFYCKPGQVDKYSSVKVANPDGKDVTIMNSWYGQDVGSTTTGMYIYRETLSISGTSITRGELGACYINTNGQSSAWQPQPMYITRVVGYRGY